MGSCVGVRGGRIQNVVNELGGEKIDVVQWHPETDTFIANSLSPAKVMNVLLENGSETSKTATVIVPDRQLSLAIGKEGQNARLAAKLTGWRIDIKSATEAAEETLGRFEDIPIALEDMDLLGRAEALLKSQGAEGFTEEQKELLDAVVREREIEPVEQEAAAELVAEVEPEAEAVPEVEAELEEAEVELAAEAEAVPGAAEPEAEEGEEEEESGPAEAILEEEEIPTFEGEPIEDSIGWVQVEPEEDYYSGWSESEEAEDGEEEPTYEWVREDIFGEEPPPSSRPRQPAKKKTKKRSRPRRESDERSWDW